MSLRPRGGTADFCAAWELAGWIDRGQRQPPLQPQTGIRHDVNARAEALHSRRQPQDQCPGRTPFGKKRTVYPARILLGLALVPSWIQPSPRPVVSATPADARRPAWPGTFAAAPLVEQGKKTGGVPATSAKTAAGALRSCAALASLAGLNLGGGLGGWRGRPKHLLAFWSQHRPIGRQTVSIPTRSISPTRSGTRLQREPFSRSLFARLMRLLKQQAPEGRRPQDPSAFN